MVEKPFEKDLVRHAYDNVIDRCARLTCFSGNVVRNLESEDIIAREKTLAIDDLISLAISSRRLSVSTRETLRGPKFQIPKHWFNASINKIKHIVLAERISLQRLFGVIIHCESLEIIDSDLMARVHFDQRSFNELLRDGLDFRVKESYRPMVLIKSDQSESIVFDIGELISCIDKNLLPRVIEAAKKHGIYLEKEWP